MTHRILQALLLVAAAALTLACTPNGQQENSPYRTVATSERDIIIAVEAAGVIEPLTTVEVKSKASGEILELLVDTGDRIEADSVLVKIDQRIPRNALAQAEANLEVARAGLDHAQAQLRRMQQLHTRDSVSNVDFERAQLDVANARAEVVRAESALENARIQMDDTELRAPISGTIIERFAERGQVISSPVQDLSGGTTLLTMAELSQVRVRTLIDETDIGKIAPGVAANVSVSAYPNQRFNGRVTKIEPRATLEQNVTMFPVLVDLDNSEGLLKPGMNATVNIDIAQRRQVLAVPNAALRTMADAGMAAELVGLNPDAVRRLFEHNGDTDTAEAPAGMPDLARMQEIRSKIERGEALTDEERALVAAVRQRIQQFSGAASGSDGAGAGRIPSAQRRSQVDGLMGGRYLVFVANGQSVEPRLVETGITDLDYTEIRSGLEHGEQVYLLPSASLQRSQQMFNERINQMTGNIPGMSGGRR